VTIAIRPSEARRDSAEDGVDLGARPSEIFFTRHLDSPNQIESPHEFGFFAHAIFMLKGWSSDATLDKNQLICRSGKSAWPVARSDKGISVGCEADK
jgi:hypothetical protein